MSREGVRPSARRRGRFVVLVGPDGVGKTSVASELLALAGGPTCYFHFRPRRDRVQPEPGAVMPASATGQPPGRFLGVVRLLLNFLRFWSGYLIQVRPVLRAGGLAVGDRWAYGYLANPAPLRFSGPRWLAEHMIRLLPRPDLAVALVARADEIHRRKPELTVEEVERQLVAWSQLPGPVTEIDATGSPAQVAKAILIALGDTSVGDGANTGGQA